MREGPSLMTPTAVHLLLPLFLHFGLVVCLYAGLTWARLVVVQRGEAAKNDFARLDGDPPLSARLQRNLANQFEAPVLAWIAAILLVLTSHATPWDVGAAWVFLIGRLIHTGRPAKRRQCRLARAGVHDQFPGRCLVDGPRLFGRHRRILKIGRRSA